MRDEAAHDLRLFIDNDGDLYRQMTTSIHKNLVTKRARGIYKHDLAVKAFGYLVEAGAKKYAKGYDVPWHKMFDVTTRRATAEALARSFEQEAALGNYDDLLPKKYQKPATTSSSHALKKKSMADYEAEGYGARTWYLASCPYQQPKIRDAWQRGAWKWQQEQRGAKKASPASAHARKKHTAGSSRLDREIAEVVPSWRRGR